MICVYPADCTDFSTNGNGALAPLTAQVTETLNGEYELQLTHPIDVGGKWQRLMEGCILRAPVPAAMTPRVNFTAPGDDIVCCRVVPESGFERQISYRSTEKPPETP